MKTLLSLSSIASIALLASLSSCSSDDSHPGGGVSENTIRFGAVTEYSRAGEVTTNNLKEFNVYAYLDNPTSAENTPYINNVTVLKGNNNTWTYSPVAYWPSNSSLSFYAYAPSGWVGEDGPLKAVAWDNVKSGYYPANTDLVYAVSPNLRGYTDSPNAQVIFNFRHALSKVTVKMSSSSDQLRVQVSNVAIAGIKSRGNFTFPSGNTADAPNENNVGTWSGQNTPFPIVLHFSQTEADCITLTTTPTDMGDTGWGIGGAKFMIPQLLSWRSNGMGYDTYIAVMCSVYDAESGVKLWPNANTPEENIVEGSTFNDGLLKFPLSTSAFSEWHPGYHYIYNLVINSNEEMGAINFGTPTVDTYVEVNTTYE